MARCEPAPAHRRDDRQRDAGRPRGVPGRRHGRLRDQADPGRGARGGSRASRAARRRWLLSLPFETFTRTADMAPKKTPPAGRRVAAAPARPVKSDLGPGSAAIAEVARAHLDRPAPGRRGAGQPLSRRRCPARRGPRRAARPARGKPPGPGRCRPGLCRRRGAAGPGPARAQCGRRRARRMPAGVASGAHGRQRGSTARARKALAPAQRSGSDELEGLALWRLSEAQTRLSIDLEVALEHARRAAMLFGRRSATGRCRFAPGSPEFAALAFLGRTSEADAAAARAGCGTRDR